MSKGVKISLQNIQCLTMDYLVPTCAICKKSDEVLEFDECCDEDICKQCITVCAYKYCVNKICETCTFICKGELCETNKVCEDCIFSCAICKKEFCQTCTKKCRHCGKTYCSRCLIKGCCRVLIPK